ncbi:unnamed protein product [Leuciscus chuanchicus]
MGRGCHVCGGASGVPYVHGLPWAEPVNFVGDVASSGVLEEFETYRGGFVHRDYSGGRQGSCQPIILNDSDVKRGWPFVNSHRLSSYRVNFDLVMHAFLTLSFNLDDERKCEVFISTQECLCSRLR